MKSLTQADVFKVANAPKRSDSIKILRKRLDFQIEINDEYKYEILLDLTLDLIEFCLSKGFTLAECVACVELQHHMLEQIAWNDAMEIKNCLAMFIDSLARMPVGPLTEAKAIALIDYTQATVLAHFHLYKYVLRNERDSNVRAEEREFLGPRKPIQGETAHSPLKDPKPYSIWLYEQQMYELEMREKNVKGKFEHERHQWTKSEEDLVASMVTSRIRSAKSSQSENRQKLDEEMVKKLIDEISVPMLNTSAAKIKVDFKELKEVSGIQRQKHELQQTRPTEDEKLLQRVSPIKANKKK